MLLAPLKVVGPISTLVTSVRVQGQLAGTLVSVISLADHQVKASGIATIDGDQRFELLPNLSLNKTDHLVATQTLGIETSELPADHLAVAVQQAPQTLSDIDHVKIETYPYEGDGHLWISGCTPGAIVEAFFNGKIQGRGISEEGVVRLELAAKIQKGVPVSVYQVVTGVGTGPHITMMPESPHFGNFQRKLYPLTHIERV